MSAKGQDTKPHYAPPVRRHRPVAPVSDPKGKMCGFTDPRGMPRVAESRLKQAGVNLTESPKDRSSDEEDDS